MENVAPPCCASGFDARKRNIRAVFTHLGFTFQPDTVPSLIFATNMCYYSSLSRQNLGLFPPPTAVSLGAAQR